MKKTINCIICPNSCEMTIDYNGSKISSIEGHSCLKGEEYAYKELFNPMRTVCSSVISSNKKDLLVSVKTSSPIPKSLIFKAMEEIKKVKINTPINSGDIIIKNFLNLECDLISTRTIK
ncbi:DUF1667 domain-containing protein [Peptoniphilus stercorisuis]|uniref:CxxC motif-containing protein n=1 Tax=Peptoniphilus stercorisuis TaxID=1436965 RepID=A0ABS4KCR5_9FIRM|nr:DUF1667 domain-containing protein [Peptoniphilus stercorisuis]MBP2025056.1 CxxC motif-containing protein [Peptoniphilus stercorisuis]